MKILCVDTSGPSCSVAVAENNRLIYEALVLNKLTHSVNLMPMVEDALQKSSLSIDDIDYFAAVTGPGSFTGVRIGVSAVKGMARAQMKPCIAVNALDAYYASFSCSGQLVCAMRDARNKQVYAAIYRDNERLLDYSALTLDELFPNIKNYNGACLFVGDGTYAYKDDIMHFFNDKAVIAPLQLNVLRASSAAAIALNNIDKAVPSDKLSPFYLRKPQAERERECQK